MRRGFRRVNTLMHIYNEKEKLGQREIYHVQIDNMEKQGL